MKKSLAADADVRFSRRPGEVLVDQHDAGRTIAARRHLVEPERFDDRPLRQHFFQRDRLPKLRDRVHRRVPPVLDRDSRKLLTGGVELVDIARGIHRIPGNRREAERRVEIDVAGGAHRIHHVFDGGYRRLEIDAEPKCYPRFAEPDIVRRGLECQGRGHAVAKHLKHRAGARQAQIVRDERRKIFLLGVGARLREGERRNLCFVDAGVRHRVDHDLRQYLVFEHL